MKFRLLNLGLLCVLMVAGFPQQGHADCKSPLVPAQGVFRDLRGVNLYVEILPERFLRAETCHGREKECVDDTPARNRFPEMHPDNREGEIAKLIDDYKALPEALRRATLIKLFSAKIREKYSSFMPHDTPCESLGVTIVDKKELQWRSEARDTLTIVVSVRLFEDMNPHVALLTTNVYRPKFIYSNLTSQIFLGSQSVIPLDLPADRIKKLVSKFADGLVAPTIYKQFDK